MGKGARTKGYFKNMSTGEVKSFMFNPNTISTSRDVEFSTYQGCGCSYPKFQYTGGGEEEISFSLFLKGNHSELASHMKFINGLMPSKNPLDRFKVPPTVLFAFGEDFVEECLFTKLDKKHQEFDSNLGTTQLTYDIRLKVVR